MQSRVLVTHGVQFLPQVDQIIVLNGGRISEVEVIKNIELFLVNTIICRCLPRIDVGWRRIHYNNLIISIAQKKTCEIMAPVAPKLHPLQKQLQNRTAQYTNTIISITTQ